MACGGVAAVSLNKGLAIVTQAGDVEPKASKRARPKKSMPLTMRVTEQTRRSLEAESDRTGRSISEVAETWINAARDGRASTEAVLGGSQVADAVRAMIAFAHAVTEHIGDPRRDPAAREALVGGWAHLAGRAIPFAPLTEADISLANVAVPLKQACLSLFEAEGKANLDQILKSSEEGRLSVKYGLQVLRNCYEGPGLSNLDTIARLGEVLNALASSEYEEVGRKAVAAQRAFKAFELRWKAYKSAVDEAVLRGRDLAERMSAPTLMTEAAKRKLDYERYGYTADLAIGLERKIAPAPPLG